MFPKYLGAVQISVWPDKKQVLSVEGRGLPSDMVSRPYDRNLAYVDITRHGKTIRIWGVMDLIDLPQETSIRNVDWKGYDPGQPEIPAQAYALVLRELNKRWELGCEWVEFEAVGIPSGKRFHLKWKIDDLDAVEARVFEMAEKYLDAKRRHKAGEELARTPGKHCTFCSKFTDGTCKEAYSQLDTPPQTEPLTKEFYETQPVDFVASHYEKAREYIKLLESIKHRTEQVLRARAAEGPVQVNGQEYFLKEQRANTREWNNQKAIEWIQSLESQDPIDPLDLMAPVISKMDGLMKLHKYKIKGKGSIQAKY